MKRIVIVVGHPRKNTFCEALAKSYADAARAAGHQASLFVLGAMHFDRILWTGFHDVQPLENDLKVVHNEILAADHLLLVFPLWLGDMPALLNGFLERVLRPDIFEPYRNHQFLRLLKGKSARIVITMGMPSMVFRLWYGAHSLKILRDMILSNVGVSPIHTTLLGRVDNASSDKRHQWLQHLAALGRKAA